MVDRQLRWYMETDTGEQVPQRHRWTVALVNAPRELRLIRERLLAELAPVSDIEECVEMVVPDSEGLHFKVFSFSSDKGRIECPEIVYSSRRFYRDRNLLIKRNEGSWEAYMSRLS